jgi:hypothetical protein
MATGAPEREITKTTYSKVDADLQAAILAKTQSHVPVCVKDGIIVDYAGKPADNVVVTQDEDGEMGVDSLAFTSIGCDGASAALFEKNKEGKWTFLELTSDLFSCDIVVATSATGEFFTTSSGSAKAECVDADHKTHRIDSLRL